MAGTATVATSRPPRRWFAPPSQPASHRPAPTPGSHRTHMSYSLKQRTDRRLRPPVARLPERRPGPPPGAVRRAELRELDRGPVAARPAAPTRPARSAARHSIPSIGPVAAPRPAPPPGSHVDNLSYSLHQRTDGALRYLPSPKATARAAPTSPSMTALRAMPATHARRARPALPPLPAPALPALVHSTTPSSSTPPRFTRLSASHQLPPPHLGRGQPTMVARPGPPGGRSPSRQPPAANLNPRRAPLRPAPPQPRRLPVVLT